MGKFSDSDDETNVIIGPMSSGKKKGQLNSEFFDNINK